MAFSVGPRLQASRLGQILNASKEKDERTTWRFENKTTWACHAGAEAMQQVANIVDQDDSTDVFLCPSPPSPHHQDKQDSGEGHEKQDHRIKTVEATTANGAVTRSSTGELVKDEV